MERKTFYAIYSDTKLPEKQAGKMKKYSFNTSSDIKIGQMIKTTSYKSRLQIVGILDEAFDFVDVTNGKFTNEKTSRTHFPLRDIDLSGVIPEEKEKGLIYGTLSDE